VTVSSYQHASGALRRVCITGGAGFLGINLARYLDRHGVAVTSLDLVPFDYPDLKDRVEAITGDTRDPAAVARAMEGCDAVVHTAAALPLYPPGDIYTTDVEGTRNALRSAREAGIDRVVHISSTAVYGIPDHHPLCEDDRLDGVGPYGQAKIQAEMVCLEARARGMTVPILRPKSFVGPERLGVFALLYDWALEGHNFPMIGSGDNRYQLLDVEDLCAAIWLCLTLPAEVVNDTFNIGAAEFTTMKRDYQVVLDAAGHGKRVVGLPAAPMVWALRGLDRLGVSPLYRWVYETAGTDSFVSIDKARERLGWEPRYSNQEALLRNFAWYRENLDRFKGESGVSHRVPWKQGVLGLAKRLF
jgi:nucleoside-diphosphate-sugar epimerase